MNNLALIEQKEREFALEKDRFEVEQRMAKSMISGSILPAHFKNIGDVMVLNEMSRVLNISTVMLAQQLYIVKGKPSMSGQLVIAILNGSGRFDKPIQWEDREETWGIRAFSFIDGEKVVGDWIDDNMIEANGWGSNTKWKTMKNQMARYRSASWFGRLYAPDVLLGFQESEEIIDTQMEPVQESTDDLNAMLSAPVKKQKEEDVPLHDEVTGEVIDAETEKDKSTTGEVSTLVASKYPLFIKMGVKRVHLNEFVTQLNLNAANIDEFVKDEQKMKDQIEAFYAFKS